MSSRLIENFDRALEFVLLWEGGYVNDPDDPGGETYKGISRKNWSQWGGWTFVDSKDLNGADAFVRDFYFEEYWMKAGCDKLEPHAAMIVFDTAVNMGVGRALELLKGTSTWQDYLIARIDKYNNMASRGNNIKFLRGWINRTISLFKTIQRVSLQ